MNKLMSGLAFVAGIALSTWAIGDQHGLFRSQSTQGDPWQGNAEIVAEEYRITVYPDYLDVELDWEFVATGTAPAAYGDALEIVGNLNLVDKSVVVGMITWWKGDILKGKLKTNDVAREQYEDVVDRSSDAPPPPRDPVLLEYITDDNYDISIFPVEFGKTRKVRIRYLIPAISHNGVNKIDYPHAFTDNATVHIRKGEGVESYRIETTRLSPRYENVAFNPLSSGEYQFSAWGGDYQKRISSIVPSTGEKSTGSTFYVGSFSTASFSGQMAHVSVMSAQEAIHSTAFEEDFVILWRWNHPQVLRKYARQIVQQSGLLKEFLSGLTAANKRAALIIDKEGGERVTFTLGSKGSAEFERMLAYLAELEKLPIVEPPLLQSARTGEIAFDRAKAFDEFESAIAHAMTLFGPAGQGLRHLLILTAGPRLVNAANSDKVARIDSTISVALLTNYVRSISGGQTNDHSAVAAYWPGVSLEGLIYRRNSALRVTAVVSSETHDDTLIVQSGGADNAASISYCMPVSQTQKHYFSPHPLINQVRWSVLRDQTVLASYTETPRVVTHSDGMQYARVIGGSKHLTPLADKMPTSLASTLGFIDTKYSLVALEEDRLPVAEASRYASQGVPLLLSNDIFADASERSDQPIAEWLKVNAPQPMGAQYCGWWNFGFEEDGVFMVRAIKAVMVADMAQAPELAFGRIAVAPAQPLYADNPELFIDYESALAAQPQLPAAKPSLLSVRVQGAMLIIDLSGISQQERKKVRVVMHDLSGKVVRELSGANAGIQGIMQVGVASLGIARGTYLVRVSGPGTSLAAHVSFK